jgi:hypothetical protein
LPKELISDLRPVAVRDHEPRLVEQRRHRGDGAAEVRQLLGRRSSLSRSHQGISP